MTAPRTAAPAGERGDYLAEVSALLWPPPARSGPSARNAREESSYELLVLPGWRRPRLLVPASRRPGRAAVRRYGEPGSLRASLGTRLLAGVIGAGLADLALRDRLAVTVPAGAETIESMLTATLGRPVLVSLHLGAARANRKPVLQLLTSEGDTIGFAKVGMNPLTRQLVLAEHTALTTLAGAAAAIAGAGLLVPRTLGLTSWNDLDILVLSPLPVWQRRRPTRSGQLAAAMRAVAALRGVRQAPLAGSDYLRRLSQRLTAAAPSADQAALAAQIARLGGPAGDRMLAFGASHGDWTRWNMASTAAGLLVWDWERFTEDAPVGFDALHYWLQSAVVDPRREPAQAAAECVRRAAGLLAELDVAPEQARLTALAYLADLSVRYLADRQQEAGARLGAPGRWLLPVLQAETAGL